MLYTKEQADRFRDHYGDIVRARLRVYAEWIRSLPLLEWIPYIDEVSPKDYEVVIGLICLAYREGLVNLTFSSDFRRIRRDPG